MRPSFPRITALLLALTLFVALPRLSLAQGTRDSVVCTKCIDSLVISHPDSAVVRVDTVWRYFTWADTLRRDSVVPVPIIQPPDTTPPPTGGSHEPAGFRPLIVNTLAALKSNGTGPVGFQSWGGPGLGTVIDSATGVPVLNCRHNPGQRGGSPSCTIWANEQQLKAANVTTLYTRFEMWVDPHFILHASGVEKIIVLGVGKSPNQYIGALSGGFRMRNSIQGVNPPLPTIPPGQSWGGPSCSASLGCSWAPPAGGKNVRGNGWHTIEFLTVSDVAGSNGSAMSVWVDGTISATYSGFDFLFPVKQGTDPRWSKWTISTYWGGTGGTYPSPGADIRFRNLYVSGR